MSGETAAPPVSTREVVTESWNLMVGGERLRGLGLCAVATSVEGVTLLGLAMAALLLGLVVQDDFVASNAMVSRFHQAVGSPEHRRFVVGVGSGVLVLRLASIVGTWLMDYLMNLHVARCETRLSQDLFAKVVMAPYVWYLTRNTTLIADVFYNDVVSWGRGFVRRTLTLVLSGITTGISIPFILALAPLKGIVAFAVLVGIAWSLVRVIRPRIAMFAERKRSSLDRVRMASIHALTGVKDVKLSSREDHFLRIFDDAIERTTRTHATLTMLNQVPSLILTLLGQVIFIGVILWIATQSLDRGVVAAQVALLVLVVSRLSPAITMLTNNISLITNAAPGIMRIVDLERSLSAAVAEDGHEEDGAGKDLPATWKVIGIDGMGFTYPGSTNPALRDVSTRLEFGKCYGLVGCSGAGKSTFVDLLLGLLKPTTGRITIDDLDLSEGLRREWQVRLAYVPQTPFILDDTLRANVAFGVLAQEVDDDRVRESLRLAGLEKVVQGLERGLDTSLGDRGSRFSGGQRQRVTIARALYNDPQLLVLDEATSALDSITEEDVQRPIARLKGSMTTVIIAHRFKTLAHCDEILVFEDGALTDHGAHASLWETNDHYRRLSGQLDVPGTDAEAE